MTKYHVPEDVNESPTFGSLEPEWMGERFVIFHVPDLCHPWRAYERHTGRLVATCIDGPQQNGKPSGYNYVHDYVAGRETFDW